MDFNTSVQLQQPFSYAWWPWTVLGLLLIGSAIWYLVWNLIKISRRKAEEKRRLEALREKAPERIPLEVLKGKYMNLIFQLETKLMNGQINNRDAYTELSSIFRTFVFEATGIEAHKYTLYDIQGLNIPIVYNLVDNYYSPEFAENNPGNIRESIEITKGAVSRWI